MADFRAQVRAELEPKSVESLVSQIQSALSKNDIKINVAGNFRELENQARQSGKNIGDELAQNIKGSLDKINSKELFNMKFKVDKGDLDTKLEQVWKMFDSINKSSTDVRANIEKLNQAYATATNTSTADKARLAAYKEFNSILPILTGQLKQAATAEKEFQDTASKIKSIDLKIETSDIQSKLKKVNEDFKNLSNGSASLAINIKKLEVAYQTVSNKDAGAEQRIAAYERFNAILPTVTTQLSQAATAEKEFQKNASAIKELDFKIDLGGFDSKIKSIQETFSSLTTTSQTMTANMEKLNSAFAVMTNTSASDEARLAAYKEFNAILPTLTGQLKEATSAEKEMASAAEQFRNFEWKMELGEPKAKLDSIAKSFEGLQSASAVTQKNFERLKEVFNTMTDTSKSDRERLAAYQEFNAILPTINMQIRETAASEKEMAQAASDAEKQQRLLTNASTLSNNMETWLNNNKKAAKEYGDQIRQLQAQLKNPNITNAQFQQVSAEFRKIQSEAKAAGLSVSQFAMSMKSAITTALGIGSVYQAFNTALRTIKGGVSDIVALDTALVDLQKTTTATTSQLNEFYFKANDIAKSLGSTTQEVIQAAADWSRLGYAIEDAQTMAKTSSIFASISPGMDIEKATDGLVSVMKAYKVDASDALDEIASKINIIGNTQAVSNNDLVEILTRSSSAMAAANNTLDQTIALGTAATEITRNASMVGTALRTKLCAYVQKCA